MLQSSSPLTSVQLKMVLIKCCDISNEVRPMEVAEPWVDCLLEEYFMQVRTTKDGETSSVTALKDSCFAILHLVTKAVIRLWLSPLSLCVFISLRATERRPRGFLWLRSWTEKRSRSRRLRLASSSSFSSRCLRPWWKWACRTETPLSLLSQSLLLNQWVIFVLVCVCVTVVPTDRGGDGASTQRVKRPIRRAQTDRRRHERGQRIFMIYYRKGSLWFPQIDNEMLFPSGAEEEDWKPDHGREEEVNIVRRWGGVFRLKVTEMKLHGSHKRACVCVSAAKSTSAAVWCEVKMSHTLLLVVLFLWRRAEEQQESDLWQWKCVWSSRSETVLQTTDRPTHRLQEPTWRPRAFFREGQRLYSTETPVKII